MQQTGAVASVTFAQPFEIYLRPAARNLPGRTGTESDYSRTCVAAFFDTASSEVKSSVRE